MPVFSNEEGEGLGLQQILNQALADLSTPDGSRPPLNDSNKRPIQSANFLRWNGEYGDEEVGRMFATTFDDLSEYHSQTENEDQFYLAEAAIPFDNERAPNSDLRQRLFFFSVKNYFC